MKIDVIIPTYRPGKKFLEMMKRLSVQSVKADRIIIMNTEEKYFDGLLYGTDFAREYPEAEVHHLSKREYDHGGTRDAAASKSSAELFLCMTDDAVPADNRLIERLRDAVCQSEDIAVAYARQLAGKESGEIERFTRSFNYPEEGCVKGREQLGTMGIKTYFCSNVCAMYRRDIFCALGGFEKHTIFNEDMIYAARAVKAGYRIAYEADACVYHSHDYTAKEQFRRNFDNGVSQAQHPEIFSGISSESEGVKLVKKTAAHLCGIGKPWLVPRFFADCGARYLGFWLGKHYQSLPAGLVVRCSMNRDYWKRR
ncbi:MAG TPA: glycosyltransferase [Candidatus Eisenbergiella merdipullorum]|uniref:Glycosyltransferase n=1 Tax=Candidatus Eisenbergiella merdipullorum TaxID=2838553 RepID=A0A9D2I8E5_9FIRM|nr:glycosyltransferase [Candidatus Eisenbergiella merdipullorum]